MLFERTLPVITPTFKKISEENFEQITLFQPAIFNLQSSRDTVLTETQLQSPPYIVLTPRQLQLQQPKIKFQVIRFMHFDRQNLDSQKFTFEQLKNSNYLQQYTEDQIHYFLNYSKEFHEDNQGNVVYMKEET